MPNKRSLQRQTAERNFAERAGPLTGAEPCAHNLLLHVWLLDQCQSSYRYIVWWQMQRRHCTCRSSLRSVSTAIETATSRVSIASFRHPTITLLQVNNSFTIRIQTDRQTSWSNARILFYLRHFITTRRHIETIFSHKLIATIKH